ADLLQQDDVGLLGGDPGVHPAAECGPDAVDVDSGDAEHGPIISHATDTAAPAPVVRRYRSAGIRLAHGHQLRRPMSCTSPGTSRLRTMNVSINTPAATMNASWARNSSGITHSAEKVAASTSPAEVITPPVLARPRFTPARVPS